MKFNNKLNKERFMKVKTILVDCQPRYWVDSEVNGIEDVDFYESKGVGTPKMPCAEQIREEPTSCIYSDHWAWRPTIEVETGLITNWNKGTTANLHYKVCDAFSCLFQDEKGFTIKQYDGYVPPFMCPKDDGYGDYIIMDIDKNGYIQDWNKNKVKEFIEK